MTINDRKPRDTDPFIEWEDPTDDVTTSSQGTYKRTPWHYSGMGEVWCHAQNRPICQTWIFLSDDFSKGAEAWGTYDADGALISAAPEMYESLKAILALVEKGEPIPMEVLEEAKYAINKAHYRHWDTDKGRASFDLRVRYAGIRGT